MIESMVVNFVTPGIQKLPNLDLSGIFEQDGVQNFIDCLSVASYMLPWDTVTAIVAMIISFYTIRIIIAFFKALWGVLPLA